MKVNRRGASSPSLVEPTSVNVNGNYYQFELEPHHVEKGKRGQKLFVCDLCPAPNGVFKRSFSLKRHYLRFHINFAFLSPRDLNNCAIAVASQQQRSGYPAGVNNGLINRLSSSLIYRCHQCGCLLRTKNDLLKHLETHPSASNEEFINGDDRGTNRCPRCSTAFSLRKTLMRHIKKNRCRGGGPPPAAPPPTTTKNEPIQQQLGETTSDQCDESAREEESEEMDMEASLRLGCPTSLFRFACTLCAKMFNSYVNMCRHRRLAHGRYGICSPHWLLSRKLSGKSMLNHSVPSPVISMTRNLQNSQDLSHFVTNANDNLTQFIDGKIVHIRSTVPDDVRFGVPDASVPPPDRWSWKEMNYNVHEIQKLDVPIQLAYYRGLQLWKIQETAKMEDSSSQAEPEDSTISSALNLRPAAPSADKVDDETTVDPPPELSGEWVRSKNYICAPCGHLFHDFYALLDHQQGTHHGVVSTHIQLDQSAEIGLAEELTRQIKRRSGDESTTSTSTTFQCTKCHFIVQSIAELHSHILLCSNHVSASPSRKRRFKVNQNSRHWSQSRGMQRTISSQTKNSSAPRSLRSRSPKEDVAEEDGNILRRSARRVLSFNEKPPSKKKKKNASTVSKRVLRQRPDTPRVNETSKTIQNGVVKKKVAATPTVVVDEVHECDGCQKKFQSRTSVLKHKHYCPNKQSAIDVTPTLLVKPSVNGQSKNKIKSSSTPSAGTPEHSAKKQQVKNVPSPKTKSKTPVPAARSNGIHSTPKILDAQKKLAKSKKILASPPPPLVKSKIKLKKAADSKKSKRKSPKTAIKEEEEEEEIEEITITPGRPVRSSRKTSMTLVMEDQVEASFLEALSPEQRIRVAEQRCPFCSKHYVYRSNFKKHLLEGCDTADADAELPVTPIIKKTLIAIDETRVKKTSVSADSKVEKTREIKLKKEDKPNKKTLQTKKTNPKPTNKPEETNKKTIKTPKNKATKVSETINKLAPTNKKKITDKIKVVTGKKKVQRKSETTEEESVVIRKDSDKLNRHDSSANCSEQVESPSIITQDDSSVIDEVKDSSEANGVSQLKTDEMSSDVVGTLIPENDLVVKENGTSCLLNSCESTGAGNDKETEVDLSIPQSEITSPESNSDKSHALDKQTLGQALNDALKCGIFKSYASLTKYPLQMRQLKTMAQVYCQLKTTDVAYSFDSSLKRKKSSS